MQQSGTEKVVHIRRSIAVLVAIASVVTLAGTASQAQHEGAGKLAQTVAGADAPSQVMISNYAFSPVPLTVRVGTTVTWINHDDDAHAVDSTEGRFKSKALNTDDKFEFRFTEAGEYPFNCRFHPKMTGKIIVQP